MSENVPLSSKPLRVVVASLNPVKLRAAARGFERMFAGQPIVVTGLNVPSGVSDQPFSDEETLRGARQRAETARNQGDAATQYWVGIEGGIEDRGPAAGMWAFAWVAVCSPQQCGLGRTGSFCLPPRVADLVRSGKELGEADDIVFGAANSKQAAGAVGLLTGSVIDRAHFYEQAVILALVTFKNPHLYPLETRA